MPPVGTQQVPSTRSLGPAVRALHLLPATGDSPEPCGHRCRGGRGGHCNTLAVHRREEGAQQGPHPGWCRTLSIPRGQRNHTALVVITRVPVARGASQSAETNHDDDDGDAPDACSTLDVSPPFKPLQHPFYHCTHLADEKTEARAKAGLHPAREPVSMDKSPHPKGGDLITQVAPTCPWCPLSRSLGMTVCLLWPVGHRQRLRPAPVKCLGLPAGAMSSPREGEAPCPRQFYSGPGGCWPTCHPLPEARASPCQVSSTRPHQVTGMGGVTSG